MQVPDSPLEIRDWDQERTDFFRYIQADEETRSSGQVEPPQPDYRVLEFIGHRNVQVTSPTKTGFQSYNEMVTRWEKYRAGFHHSLTAILALFASTDADVEAISQAWRSHANASLDDVEVTCSQALNPMQGQGQNKPKANALDTRQNLQDFWLLEYLKAGGMWRCTAPQLVRPPLRNPTQRDWDKADWKVYVLVPLNLPLGAHKDVFNDFRALISSETSLKLDVVYVLLFSKTWLEYVEAAWQDEDEFDIPGAPEQIVAGFQVAQFKPLSDKSYTMVNQSFLSLPAWSGELRTRADVVAVQQIMDEHLDVIRGIDEGHSDGFDLLRRYRDFVSSGNWNAFFDFMAGYSHEILRRLNEGQRFVPTFTTPKLRRLIMSNRKDLFPIVENGGFQNVAYAIRQATVVPQYWKAKKKHDPTQQIELLYDVHYGLAAELRRKGTVRDDFVSALTSFMQSYNQETLQVYENKGRQTRRYIRPEDIQEVVKLIDEYQNPELVSNLLIALGYAWEM